MILPVFYNNIFKQFQTTGDTINRPEKKNIRRNITGKKHIKKVMK